MVKEYFSARTKTIKVEVNTWDLLKNLKRENETFNDVIRDLIKQRTVSAGNENIKLIRYSRKHLYVPALTFGFIFSNPIGFEIEYNDIKSEKLNFVLDLKIKQLFYGRKAYPLSQFYGVDNTHKHYSDAVLLLYLKAVELVLIKEFRVTPGYFTSSLIGEPYYFNLSLWRELYEQYNLSKESLKLDIEDPLRLSEEEKPQKIWKTRIEQSVFYKLKLNSSVKSKQK